MSRNNKNLLAAKVNKNDCFYTLYEDVEKECSNYIEHFAQQWIYCPCDDENSNFWIYFKDNFNNFKLKHLTATHINFEGTSYRLDYDGKNTTKTELEGNGDFRSEECTKIKDEADIVCTNPPFSLWRQFFFWLNGGEFEKNNKGIYVRKN